MRFASLGFGWTTAAIMLSLLAGAGTGCQNKLHDENVALHRQNRELQQRLTDSDMRSRNSADQSQQIDAMNREIQARDAKIAELQSQLQSPSASASMNSPSSPQEDSNLLKGIEVTRDDRAGTLTVNLPGDVLFSSGSAELKSSARTTLDKVITAVKKDYPGKKVLVKGYTDTDPITKTKDKWEDNLDLSAARARTVAKYLTTQGLSSQQVGLQAYGETMPKGTKDRSRRVEIVVATRD